MKQIPLTQNKYALIDDEDFDKINQYKKWYARWTKDVNSYYAIGNITINGQYKKQYMHRIIMGLDFGDLRQVDHINHDTLDNRKSNLRIVTHRINHHNSKNQSKYGACIGYRPKNSSINPFCVNIHYKNKICYVGIYPTLFDAIIARDLWLQNIKRKP